MKRILLILLVLCYGCDDATSSERASRNIHYIKDNRTGLCFVDSTFTSGNVPITNHIYTNVPCTKEVEDLLIK